jgi:hypothetical protein
VLNLHPSRIRLYTCKAKGRIVVAAIAIGWTVNIALAWPLVIICSRAASLARIADIVEITATVSIRLTG